MMKKILTFLILSVMIFGLASCEAETILEDGLVKIADAKGVGTSDGNDNPSSENNSQGSSDTENESSDNEDENEEAVTEDNIILNVSSKKIHLSPECTYAKSMSEANKRIDTKDKLQEYLESKYSICSNCNKKYADGN